MESAHLLLPLAISVCICQVKEETAKISRKKGHHNTITSTSEKQLVLEDVLLPTSSATRKRQARAGLELQPYTGEAFAYETAFAIGLCKSNDSETLLAMLIIFAQWYFI